MFVTCTLRVENTFIKTAKVIQQKLNNFCNIHLFTIFTKVPECPGKISSESFVFECLANYFFGLENTSCCNDNI